MQTGQSAFTERAIPPKAAIILADGLQPNPRGKVNNFYERKQRLMLPLAIALWLIGAARLYLLSQRKLLC